MSEYNSQTLRDLLHKLLPLDEFDFGLAELYHVGLCCVDVWSALEAKLEAMEDALRQIAQWSDAYPLDVFPEPNFARAHELLKAGGMTLDAISASNMRHVVEGVGRIAKAALDAPQEQE